MDSRLEDTEVNELPSGFTPSPDQKDSEDQQRQAQKEAILEQALTPDALARLRRIKVSRAFFSLCRLRASCYCFHSYGHFSLGLRTIACEGR
jgi:hypothetical protein